MRLTSGQVLPVADAAADRVDVVLESRVRDADLLSLAGVPLSQSHAALLTFLRRQGSDELSRVFCTPVEGSATQWHVRDVHPGSLRAVCDLPPAEHPAAAAALNRLIADTDAIRTRLATPGSARLGIPLAGLVRLLHVPSEACILFDGRVLRILQWGEVARGDDPAGEGLLRAAARRLSTVPPPVVENPRHRDFALLAPPRRFWDRFRSRATRAGAEAASRRTLMGGRCGAVTVTLMWNTPDDVDLSVACPDGQVIGFRNKSACGGVLDVDMNAGGVDSASPVENVFWAAQPPPGDYIVRINNFRGRQADGAGSRFLIVFVCAGRTRDFIGNAHPAAGPRDVFGFRVGSDGAVAVTGDAGTGDWAEFGVRDAQGTD